jgi:cysteine-S-conjugate beta-lyase
VMVNTPVYPPFLSAPVNQGRVVQDAQLAVTTRRDEIGRAYLYYEMDFDAMPRAVAANSRLFMLCNPHNPVGRAYTRPELEQLAEFCLRNNLVISSDEIHCDLLLDGAQHIPFASLSPEIADQTITLLAPSKTFNVPGLGCSLAIAANPELRKRLNQAASGIVPHVNVMGIAAAHAAYSEGGPWLDALRAYLTANRNLVFDFMSSNFPQIPMTLPQATYLAWLDFRNLDVPNPYRFFLDEAGVALSDGAPFGKAGEGFVRLNFGCRRSTLQQALDKMATALQARA